MTSSEILAVSVVVVGKFNPAIFQPLWFASEGLLRKEEADNAAIEVVHSDVTSFVVNDAITIQVMPERFSVTSEDARYREPLRDLVVGTLGILRHTPIRMLGINYELHAQMASREELDKIGHALAPKSPWMSILAKPGLITMTMQSDGRDDDFEGYTQVRVEPSKKIENGVFIGVNDHFVTDKPNSVTGTDRAHMILTSNWERSLQRSLNICQSIRTIPQQDSDL